MIGTTRLPSPTRRIALTLCVLVGLVTTPAAQQPSVRTFQPPLAVPETLEPYLAHLEPGKDAFPLERDAQAIEGRLAEIGAWLKAGARDAAPAVFSAGFKGARLRPSVTATDADAEQAGPLVVTRATALPDTRDLGASAFAAELVRLATPSAHAAPTAGRPRVLVTEFLVTSIEASGDATVTTDVRYDIVSQSAPGARTQHVGTWRIAWQRDDRQWHAAEWVATSHVTSRATQPLFTEVTTESFGAIPAFRQQLTLPLDEWSAALDSVLTRDSNGHHGVAVGDADGDGRDDLYIAQPSGLPNRLLRARGDGTFEDITERAGVGLLDDTAQPLLVDIDNDGDQDLVLATSVQPLLLLNDGRGRFSLSPDAFAFARPLQGVLTGISMADYDRDGFLDAYLSVYSYFFGAGEDKAGTPMPYHDARNGPPGVLFRNDGRGHFVDVTQQTGLDEGNDRYHFTAAWADYDEDGWPDLLVANDFGTKNLYRNLGPQAAGGVRFEDVTAKAGVLDHGAGMSATFLDYDNDGRLDIYTGNMWTAPGQRVTGAATFMPDAPPAVREQYRRHTRGNSLFRNRGDGTFEDTTVRARAAMGGWAWASDAIDVDSDGWQDLYVANGMLTRTASEGDDLESYFWRQVVARSPLMRVKGTPYDEAWRAINLRLVRGSIASRQRNVLLRNDGRGGFDEVGGALGLDLDQDGRAFAVLDIDRDGDQDLVVMAARQAPQLRLFRNDHPARRTIALRLTGTRSNRDAIGARVRIETDTLRGVRMVHAGTGFLSQHSRELVVGLGDSREIRSLVVEWPSGARQAFTDLALDTRYALTEGGTLEREAIDRGSATPRVDTTAGVTMRDTPESTWMYEPFPAPAFAQDDVTGVSRSLAALQGRPSVLLFWQSDDPASRAALDTLAAGSRRLAEARISALAIALDPPDAAARVKASAPATVPVIHANRELGLSWAIAHRSMFMNRQPLRLPTTLLLDADGNVVRLWRRAVDTDVIAGDAARIDVPEDARLARALPFAGTFVVPLSPRNYLPMGRELLDQGLEAPAIVAFERAARANPSASTLYRLGTLLVRTGESARARTAFEGALALDSTLAEAHNDLGALLAQDGNLPGAIVRFRQALAAMPDYPDALNNLGYALLLSGQDGEARGLYERALALQPDFPEALNNLGLLLGRTGDLPAAEKYFRAALTRKEAYGEAANNLALTLVARGAVDEALRLLESQLAKAPDYEGTYVTLAKLHLSAGRTADGLRVLERLLQRNPAHPLAQQLVREYRPQ